MGLKLFMTKIKPTLKIKIPVTLLLWWFYDGRVKKISNNGKLLKF